MTLWVAGAILFSWCDKTSSMATDNQPTVRRSLLTRSLRKGSPLQFKPKHASRPDRTFRADSPTHRFNKALTNDQADACALLRAGLSAKPVGRFEKLRELGRCQTLTRVPHANAKCIRRTQRKLHRNRAKFLHWKNAIGH